MNDAYSDYTAYDQTRPISVFPSTPPPALIGQVLIALFGGIVLFVLLLTLIPLGYSLRYAGRIYPGVSVAGVDLSDLTPEEAVALLARQLTFFERGQIVFQEGANLWAARPRELGLFVDASASAQAAYNIGRQGNSFNQLSAQIQVWREGIDLAPLVVYDERMAQSYLQAIAAQVDRPVVEASLGVSGVEVVVRSGQVGRTLDVPTALAVLRAHLPTLSDGIIPLIVNETPPVILDVTAQAEIARRILSAPLTITVPDPVAGDAGPWTFEPQTLAGMLTIERVITPEGARYQVGLSSEALRVFLQGVAHGFVRAPQNARFIFNDDTKQLDMLQSAVIGRALDVETSIQLINQKAAAGEHSIALDMEYTNPVATDDATAEKLGITQLVSEHTSYFYGSSGSRIQNITTASARFHGVLVAPGETFSMASVLGDVSLDSGYAEALIIYGDRTIKGVGGGVCQVSTTLFRTAFFGGFPIVERYPHAYRVGYYEQTPSGGYDTRLAGLDATVFVPVVDFKFTNDSPNWLLMETYVNATARTLTWKFYSTSDGRSVDWYTTGPTNIVEPPDPLYEENPDLDEGEIKQIDYAAEGADVTVTRTVYRNGAVVFSDQFVTHYLPWRAVYQYGPGTEGIPTPEPTEGPTPEP